MTQPPAIASAYLPLQSDSVHDLNFIDLPLYDLELYNEKDKLAATKYFYKEASFISKMVVALYIRN